MKKYLTITLLVVVSSLANGKPLAEVYPELWAEFRDGELAELAAMGVIENVPFSETRETAKAAWLKKVRDYKCSPYLWSD